MGWERYKQRTEANNKFLKLAEDKEADPEHLSKKIEKELNSIKYEVFGKVKIAGKNNKNARQLENLQLEKNTITKGNDPDKVMRLEKVDRKMASTLKDIERESFEKDIKYLEGLRKEKGKSAAVFSLKEKILGKKKSSQERTVIKDPVTGREVSTPSEIKRVSLDYLVNLLSNKPVKEEYAEVLNVKRELHFERMAEVIDNDINELSSETFEKILISLSKKPGSKYKYITRAGYSLKLALCNLFQIIWRTEKIPSDWHESNVIQLPNYPNVQIIQILLKIFVTYMTEIYTQHFLAKLLCLKQSQICYKVCLNSK